MPDPITVDIADVYSDAIRGFARDLQAGDFIFSAFGDRMKIVKVRAYKKSVRIVLDGGHAVTWRLDDEITYVREVQDQ